MLRGHHCSLVCYLSSGHCSDLQNSQGSVPEANAPSTRLFQHLGYCTLSPCHKEIRNCST